MKIIIDFDKMIQGQLKRLHEVHKKAEQHN